VVLVAAGAVACVLGIVSFRKAKTTVDPRTPESTSSLVVAGIYHYSRNPMYFGFALLLLAWGVYLSSLLAILVVPVFILYLNEYQIKPEERALEAQFGQDYVDYKKAVRRWI
ncbi:MAG: isoprenylcysteine carboxylmethyltransferase family protein, partial [Natronospirillum sp.]